MVVENDCLKFIRFLSLFNLRTLFQMEPDHPEDFSTVITHAVTASVPVSDQLSPPQPLHTPDPVAERPDLDLEVEEEPVILTMSEAEIAPEGHAVSTTSTEVATTDIYPPAPVLNIRNPSPSRTILPSSTNNNDLITITDSPPTTPTGHGNVHGQPPIPPVVAVVGASASLNAARNASMSSSRGPQSQGETSTSPPRKSCPTCTIM